MESSSSTSAPSDPTDDTTPTSSPPQTEPDSSTPATMPENTKFCYIGIHFGRFETRGAVLKYDGDEGWHEAIECPVVDAQGKRRFEFVPSRDGSVRVNAVEEYSRFIRLMLNSVVPFQQCIDGLTITFPSIPSCLKTVRSLKTKLEEVWASSFRDNNPKIYILEEHLMWSNMVQTEEHGGNERIEVEGDLMILKWSTDYSFLYHNKQVCRNVPQCWGDEEMRERGEVGKELMEKLCRFVVGRAKNIKKEMTLLLIGSVFSGVKELMETFLEEHQEFKKLVTFRRYYTNGMDDSEVAAALYGAVQNKQVSEYNCKRIYIPK